ncbi:MAG: site-2 protease family protein [Verrucomicrobiota bacterium]
MDDFGFWYLLMAFIVVSWLALPLHVAVHEFSHAVAARILSRSKIYIRLGKEVHGVWKHGSIELSFGLSRWRVGNFRYTENGSNSWRQALVIAAGPLGTFILTLIFASLVISVDHTGAQILFLPFVIYGLKILLLSLYPSEIKDRVSGEIIQTDGYKLSRIPWKTHSAANT